MIFSGHQPNFLPYMGVLYKMFMSDVFVLDDDVQYSRDGLHNSNFVKICGERHRITVPVHVTLGDAINEVKISYERDWQSKMLMTLNMNYRKAKHFDEGYEFVERYLGKKYDFLCDMNVDMLKEMVSRFGIGARIVIASIDVPTKLKNNERNVFQCSKLGCDVYYSGVGGKAYNDEGMYERNGIAVVYSDFEPIPYKQLGKEFVPYLSVIDYVMNNGFNLPVEWKKT